MGLMSLEGLQVFFTYENQQHQQQAKFDAIQLHHTQHAADAAADQYDTLAVHLNSIVGKSSD